MIKSANKLLEEAYRLADMGIRVFPLTPGDKKPPLIEGWQEKATDEKEVICAWWTTWPEANIGIVTTDKLCVIDVDPIDGKPNPWPNDPEKLANLSPVMAQTPRGGTHYFFYDNAGGFPNSVGELAPGVDTRGAGGYVAGAGSYSKQYGKYYTWAPGMSIHDNDPVAIPKWLRDEFNARKGVKKHKEKLDGLDIPSGQRNDALFRLGCGMRRNGMGANEIRAALNITNLERCKPPIESRELVRMVDHICDYEPDQISTAVVEGHWDQLKATAEVEPMPADPGLPPDEVYNAPGFINDFVDLCMKLAPYPNRALAFGAGIAMQGWLCGRKLRDQADNRTNFYTISLAESGYGKDFPRKVINKIMTKAGCLNQLVTQIASVEGLEDMLLQQKNILFMNDEVDALLNAMQDKHDTRLGRVMSRMLEIYSSASSSTPMRRKATSENDTNGVVIHQPSVNLLGTAIPKHYYAAMGDKMITNGFGSRLLVIESSFRGRGQEPGIIEIPESLMEIVRYWIEYKPGAGNLDDFNPTPHTVKCDGEAMKLIKEHREMAEDLHAEADKRGDSAATAIWSRVHEQTRKLSLTFAASANHLSPVIDAPTFKRAEKFTLHNARRMLFQLGQYVSDNHFHRECNKIIRMLRKNEMSYSKLLKNTHIPTKRLMELLETLAQQGSVEGYKDKKGVPMYRVRT